MPQQKRYWPSVRVIVAGLVLAGVCGPGAGQQWAQAQPVFMQGRVGPGRPMPAGGDVGAAKEGLHIPQGRMVSFTYNLSDGGSYLWDLQYGLYVNQGTNCIYSGGVYCQVNGSNVTSNGQGWTNQAGDEVEIGPWNRGNCIVYRRCKVYKDVAMARWLDIFTNNTGQAQTIPVRVYSCTNNTVAQTITSSGGNAFGEKDWAFITDHQQGRPSLLHIVCGPKSKLRPAVQIQQNNIFSNYNLAIPAGGTVVLCYWESQGNTLAELQERMKKFQLSKMISDLPAGVRKMIVNLGNQNDLEGVELERSGTSDAVRLKNGDSIFGRIANEKFTLEAFYGTLDLPAAQVIGFAAVPGQEDLVRAVLSGGQVLTGKLKEDKLKLSLPIGGGLEIPFAKIRQCAYQISKDKGEDQPMKDPLILLRTGDRLAFDPAALKVTFQTRHGRIELNGNDLLEIRLDHEDHGVHRAFFANGSTLGGLMGPDRITMPLRLGPKLDIARDMVHSIRFTEDDKEAPAASHLLLTNEDELFGRLADEAYVIATDFNTVTVKPANVLGMSFDQYEPGRVIVRLWDGSTLRGRLRQDALKFQLAPGPMLTLNIGHVVALSCPGALPPDEVVKQVEKLVAQLSAANYKDRQDAQEALLKMGSTIVPMLQKHAKDTDPEVRQRVAAILEQLGGGAPAPSPVPPMMIEG